MLAFIATESGMPEPVIQEEQEDLSITFLKDIFTQDYLRKLEVNERQIKAILHVKEKGQITNSDYQKINEIGKSVAATEFKYPNDTKKISACCTVSLKYFRSPL